MERCVSRFHGFSSADLGSSLAMLVRKRIELYGLPRLLAGLSDAAKVRTVLGDCVMFRPSATAAVCVLMALLVSKHAVFGQAGSTGGTIGKTDKSATGGEETDAHPRRATLDKGSTKNACYKFVGTWAWLYGLGSETTINPDGTGRNSTGLTVKWSCSGGEIVATWSHSGVDRIKISPDGNSLSITVAECNSAPLCSPGATFRATRK
jgi:hypothetical protein